MNSSIGLMRVQVHVQSVFIVYPLEIELMHLLSGLLPANPYIVNRDGFLNIISIAINNILINNSFKLFYKKK